MLCKFENQQDSPKICSKTHTYRARVDSNTIILVIHIRPSNHHIGATSNIKPIGILATARISSRVVDRHSRHRQPTGTIDADSLDRCVLDVQIRDGRVRQAVRIEELGLRLAAAAALTVPPARAVRVEVRAGRAGDGDACTFDLEEWAVPFFVAPGCFAFKNDLGSFASVRIVDVGFCFCFFLFFFVYLGE